MYVLAVTSSYYPVNFRVSLLLVSSFPSLARLVSRELRTYTLCRASTLLRIALARACVRACVRACTYLYQLGSEYARYARIYICQ